MTLRQHTDVDEFRAIAEPLYRRDPVAHTIELTLLQSGHVPEDSLLLTLWDEADIVGAAVQTPPYPLISTAIPPAETGAVVAEVARLRPDLPGVRGPRPGAVAFADDWCTSTGATYTVTVEERLHRLGTLRPPSDVAGDDRDATVDDRDLLIDWVESFYGETFGHPRHDAPGRRLVDDAWANGDRILLWRLGTTPVSMAMVRAPAWGVSRIGPVFTPADRRGQGFGTAVTAAAAGTALADGVDDVVLYTDLANPVSNAIYRRIGFQPVCDSIRIDFATAD